MDMRNSSPAVEEFRPKTALWAQLSQTSTPRPRRPATKLKSFPIAILEESPI